MTSMPTNPESQPTEIPANPDSQPVEYLDASQKKIVRALHDAKRRHLAEAYETATKLIYMMQNLSPKFGSNFIPHSTAVCLIGHLTREILNTWMRDLSSSGRVQYTETFDRLKDIWDRYAFPIDGQIPKYKSEIRTDDNDLLFPKEPVGVVSEQLNKHNESRKKGQEKAILLLRDVYGDRSEENRYLDSTLEWLKRRDFEKFAHISSDVQEGQDAERFNKVVEDFKKLEGLLVDYVTMYYDKQDELDEILSQTNG